jgi:adenine deaminase
MSLKRLIPAARGEAPADLLVRGCMLVNVLSGEIHPASVGIKDGVFLGIGDYESVETLDAGGRFLCPGLVEGHIHIESTLLDPVRFARLAAAHGTAVTVCDPHELANVLGLDGIRWLLEVTAGLPMDIRCMMPSCVPATHLETAGARISAEDIRSMLDEYPQRMPGLAEMMNYPGVLFLDPEVLAKLHAADERPVDGHAPGLTGLDLNAYILAGPGNDHEAVHLAEAREKLRKGMHVMIREGSSEKNLADLLPLVGDFNSQNFSLVTDDRHCDDLLRSGHLDHTVRLAVSLGLPPAGHPDGLHQHGPYFRLHRRGAVAPGYRADFILLDDLDSFAISSVHLRGRHIDDQSWDAAPSRITVTGSVHLGELSTDCLDIPARDGRVRVIRTVPGQIVTEVDLVKPRVENGLVLRRRGRRRGQAGCLRAPSRQRGGGVGPGARTGPAARSPGRHSGPRLPQSHRRRRQRRGHASGRANPGRVRRRLRLRRGREGPGTPAPAPGRAHERRRARRRGRRPGPPQRCGPLPGLPGGHQPLHAAVLPVPARDPAPAPDGQGAGRRLVL